jgi:hypothetical protein
VHPAFSLDPRDCGTKNIGTGEDADADVAQEIADDNPTGSS